MNTNNVVSNDDLEFFKRHGYVVLRGVLPESLLTMARAVCNDWSSFRIDEWIEQGLIAEDFADLSIEQRFITAWNAAGKPSFDRRSIYYYNIFPNMYSLVSNPTFLNIAESILNTREIAVSPVSNPRIKHHSLPWTCVPWHADLFYWEESSRGTPLDFLIQWYPLSPVGPGRGCLEVISMEEVKGVDFKVDEKTATLTDEMLDQYTHIPLELEPGDVLCMCDNVLHRSTRNLGDSPIWTIDHRFENSLVASKSTRNKGFLARSVERPNEIATLEGWMTKRDARNYLEQTSGKL